ncbi:MAG: hypothetical protein HKM03_01335, partial [Steroidobacteraceae bacterium]|nr:hypothetical protein [Steroidobacteraceae bacterium]
MASKPSDTDLAAPATRGGVLGVRIVRARLGERSPATDRVAVEAPLEILLHHPAFGDEPVSFGATMRTPGEDEALAAGLLFGEGLIEESRDIEAIESGTRRPNVVNVRLRPGLSLHTPVIARRFSAGAACGVCGTTSIDAAIARAAATRLPAGHGVAIDRLLALPARMRA